MKNHRLGRWVPFFPLSDTFRLQKTDIPIQRNSFYTIAFPAKGFGEEAAWRGGATLHQKDIPLPANTDFSFPSYAASCSSYGKGYSP